MTTKTKLVALRRSLFGTPGQAIATILVGIPTVLLAFVVVRFIFVQANWTIITDNLRLFYIGTYPIGGEWRVWVPFAAVIVAAGVSYGCLGGALRRFTISIGIIAFVLLGFGLDFVPRWLNALSFGLAPPIGFGWYYILALAILALVSAYAARRWLAPLPDRVKTITLASLWVAPIVAVLLLNATLSPNRWNALFLDLMVFAVGGVISFPLGTLLALGRTSRIPMLRLASTGYIEIVRAGPLVVWLILALFLWNDFFFPTDKVHRGMLVFGLFGAAYIAEVIRGGLQSIPRGQFEAARSLGLNTAQIYAWVILPQAFRAVVPALIGRFISLWKDTSLLIALTLINTLKVSAAILEGRPSNGRYLLEIYIIIALFYWTVSFLLSRIGAGIERSIRR